MFHAAAMLASNIPGLLMRMAAQQHRVKPPASLLPPVAGLLHPRSSHLMWNKNSIRLVLLNLSQAISQQTGAEGMGWPWCKKELSWSRQQDLYKSSRRPCSSAFVHMLLLMPFAAPGWKSSYPTGGQVKCPSHTGLVATTSLFAPKHPLLRGYVNI